MTANDKQAKTKKGYIVTDINGQKYETELTGKYFANRQYRLPDKTVLKAFIPGLISEVQVKPGQHIPPGQPLVILEAMKMLNDISVTYEVVVKDVAVKPGDVVAKNQVLMTFSLPD